MLRRPKKARWKKTRSKGEIVLRLTPAPVIKDITFDLFERGCLLLAIDPDALLDGEFDATKLPEPQLKTAREFVDLVLTRPEIYPVEDWPIDYVRSFLGVVTASFIIASFGSSVRSRLTRKTSRRERGSILRSLQTRKIVDRLSDWSYRFN